MYEDWIGEAGELEIAARNDDDWHRVDFTNPVEDAVVVATASARGADPFTLAVRNVDETGFEIRLDEWEYLDGRHGAETVHWVALSEGVHRLADGRMIEAGAATLATVGETRFSEIAFRGEHDAAPLVFGQLQSETDAPATDRVRNVGAQGFRAGLQLEEAVQEAEAATFGWIAVEPAAGAAELVRGVTDQSAALSLGGEVLIAELQTFHGADPATAHVTEAGDESRIDINEERSADRETRHAPERVAIAAFPEGGLFAASGPAAATDAPIERWSDPATWGGRVPAPGEDVFIEEGRTILIDIDVEVAGLMVHGELIVEDARDLALSADWIMVMGGGEFTVGTAAVPHQHDFTLTLTGNPEDRIDWEGLHTGHGDDDACPVTGGTCKCALREIADDQTAFLMAMGEGASIELHGADAAKTDWTRLAATAEAGTAQLTLDAATGWEEGDVIAIASTDFDADQAEERTIVAVAADGRTVTLDRPLDWMHFGELQEYEGGRILDTRAEVGLLSRNIVIRGDEDSAQDGFGGHTMVMDGAEMRISGVEFTFMGQEGLLGRYAAHWHMVGDATGQYITDSSFHHLFNRAVTMHGTQFARIEDTVAYDTIGHAYFLEDGSETGNRFESNLGFLTRAASVETALIDTDATHVSTFWITNPSNDFIGNVAAGSEHSGFWIAPGPEVTGLSAEVTAYHGIDPSTAPLGRFEGNTGHSNAFANLAIDGHTDASGAFVESEYRPESLTVIRDFTSYKAADRAIWVRAEGIEFHDIQSADNARATFFSYNQTLYDSLIVGRSANIGTPETAEEIAQGRSLPEPYFGKYFRGHSIYDGPSGVIDTHFAGFGAQDAAFQTNGAAQKSPAHFVSGLSFEDVTPRGRVDFSPQSWDAHMWSSGIIDVDGSLTGRGGATLVPIIDGPNGESRFNTTSDAIRREGWGAWVLPEAELGLLRADSSIAPGTADIVTWTRSDGARVEAGGTFDTYHQASVALNSELTYRLEYDTIPADLNLSLRFAGQGDAVILELPNFPSRAIIGGAHEVADRAALGEAEQTSFTREGTLLILRLVADGTDPDPRFAAATVLEEAAEHRFVAGVTIHSGANQSPVIADFEAPDPRLTPFARSTMVSALETATTDQSDSIVFWDVTEDGDGRPGVGAQRIALGGQDWSGADALAITASSASIAGGDTGFEVLIRDRGAGITSLGRVEGTASLDLSHIAEDRRDEVDSLIFRATTEGLEGSGQRIHLHGVTLEPAALDARPLHLAPVIAPGEEFGIVGAAIHSAIRGDGPFTIVSVSDVRGGQVRTDVPGQEGNLFFRSEQDFAGIAGFTATVRGPGGAEVRVPVTLDVAGH